MFRGHSTRRVSMILAMIPLMRKALRRALGTSDGAARGAAAMEAPAIPRAPARPPARPQDAADPCPADEILTLPACPVCGDSKRTPVSQYNRFALVEQPPDDRSTRYDYALCHTCGVVHATHRPAGARLRWLLEHFEETLGRDDDKGAATLARSGGLTEAEQDQLRRRAARGVFVSDHLGVSKKEDLPTLFRDRVANSPHVEILGSLVPMKAPRVLEIRSRLGTIPAALKRLYGAESVAMAIFENQRFLIQEVYDIPTVSPIDFDHFQVPFEGQFDLIIANHMLTHAVHPAEFLTYLHSRLRTGGHLYLYHETDEGDFLERGKSMFNNLNPFHVQAFNTASLVRALAIHGFATEFITIYDGTYICLAQARDEAVPWEPQSDKERTQREAAYRQAYDTAVLRMPEFARWQVADDWEDIVRRALDSGAATITKQGEVKLLRK